MSEVPQEPRNKKMRSDVQTGADTTTITTTMDRLEESFEEKYGDEPDVEAMTADFEDSVDKVQFVLHTRDKDGLTILHYLGDVDVSNSFESSELVRSILEAVPEAAQAVDDKGMLPLKHYADHLMDCSDDWTGIREYFYMDREDDFIRHGEHLDGIGYLIQAFPEGIFAAGLLDELQLNLAYYFDIFDPALTRDQDNDTGRMTQEKTAAKCLVGLLRCFFADAFSGMDNTLQGVQPEPGIMHRSLFHIICSYAYEPVFPSLFRRFFTRDKASIADATVATRDGGMLPRHLVLWSPVLARPCTGADNAPGMGGPILGFHQMQEMNKCVPFSAVKELVNAHKDALMVADSHGRLPIHLAVRHNNLEMIQYLVHSLPSTTRMLDHQGRSPLRYACEHNVKLDIVYFLMSANPQRWWLGFGTGIDRRDQEGTIVVAPVIAPVPRQVVPPNQYSVCVAPQLTLGTKPVRWSVSTKDILLDTIEINAVTGTLNLYFYKGAATFHVTLTAENIAGVSSTSFQVEYVEA